MTALGEASTPGERALEAAIATIGEWRGCAIVYRPAVIPVISTMHRGIDADHFTVDVDDRSFFVKITHEEQRAAIDLAGVFEASSAASAVGVAPKPCFVRPEHHAIVFDHLGAPWRAAMMHDLQDAAIIDAALAAKARLHAVPPFKRDWSIFEAIAAVTQEVEDRGIVVDDDLWWMRDAVADIHACLRAAGTDKAPSHADGLASNIMIGPDKAVRLVDFDNACNTDPLYEVGCLLNEAYAFPDQIYPVLERYEGRFREATYNRCRLYGIADDFYWGLWASLMDATSQRRGIEFLKYAKWRLLRCRVALRDYAFERMLRAVG